VRYERHVIGGEPVMVRVRDLKLPDTDENEPGSYEAFLWMFVPGQLPGGEGEG
jgi:hypothetical protein